MDPRPGRHLRGPPRKFRQALVDELIAFARQQFRLARVEPTGGTTRDHAASAQRQLAGLGLARKASAVAQAIAGSPFPHGLERLWADFNELHEDRRQGFAIPERISSGEILEWMALYGVQLAPWQIRAIRRLDREYIKSAIEALPKKKPGDKSGERRSREKG